MQRHRSATAIGSSASSFAQRRAVFQNTNSSNKDSAANTSNSDNNGIVTSPSTSLTSTTSTNTNQTNQNISVSRIKSENNQTTDHANGNNADAIKTSTNVTTNVPFPSAISAAPSRPGRSASPSNRRPVGGKLATPDPKLNPATSADSVTISRIGNLSHSHSSPLISKGPTLKGYDPSSSSNSTSVLDVQTTTLASSGSGGSDSSEGEQIKVVLREDRRGRRSASLAQSDDAVHKIRLSAGTAENKKIDSSKIEVETVSLGIPDNSVFIEGKLKKYESSGLIRHQWKQRFVRLNLKSVLIFKDADMQGKPEEISLSSIMSLQWDKAKEKKTEDIISILSVEAKHSFMVDSKEDLKKWLITIEGVRRISLAPALDEQTRTEILINMYKDNYKGGIIKGKAGWDEEWMYRSNGTLRCSMGLHKAYFEWDGRLLRQSKDGEQPGFGTFDGVTFEFYTKEGDRQPLVVYHYIDKVREYIADNGDEKMTWKWTRHFLARKHGTGEWICEGEVPEPVVMFVSIMRYIRCGNDN